MTTQRLPGTTGDTFQQVLANAITQGYTQVETAAGWIGLKAWHPYGQVEGHIVWFHLEPAHDRITETSDSYSISACPAIWPVRP